MTRSPSLPNRLAHRIVEVTGAAVAPVNNSGRGHTETPDGAPFTWTGAPVDEFRKCVYGRDSKRSLANATTDHAVIDALWSGDFANDGVAFILGDGSSIEYVDGDDRNGAVATFDRHAIDTNADGWHPRTNGRGAWTNVGFPIHGLRVCDLGPGVELHSGGHVVCPPAMTPEDVQVIPAHKAIVAAVRAALEAKRQHKVAPVNLAPVTPDAALPTDRAKAYATATLANAIDALRRAGPGKRHQILAAQSFKVGRVLHLGLSVRDAHDALVDTITQAGYKDRNADVRTIAKQLEAGQGAPVNPRLSDADTRAAFEAFGVSMWRAINAMPTGGTMPTEDGRPVRTSLVVGVMAALAELMQKRGIYGTVAASVRCIREQRGRGSYGDIQRGMSAAAAAGWVCRVGRDTRRWLAKNGNLDKRLAANAYEFDVLAIRAKNVTGKSDSKGGGVALATRAAVAVGQVRADAEGASVAPGGYSPLCSQVTVTFFAQPARMLAAGFAAGQVEVLRSAAAGASTRGEIVAAVVAAGMSRRTAYSWIDKAVAAGSLTVSGGRYTVDMGIVARMIDEHVADARTVARRAAVAAQNRRERADYRADVEYVQAIELTGRPATPADRRKRRADEKTWLRSWLAEHGERPSADDLAAYRAGVIRDVLEAGGALDVQAVGTTSTGAPTFEAGTRTERNVTLGTPTHTRQTRTAVAPLTLARIAQKRARRPVLMLGGGGVACAAVSMGDLLKMQVSVIGA